MKIVRGNDFKDICVDESADVQSEGGKKYEWDSKDSAQQIKIAEFEYVGSVVYRNLKIGCCRM